MSEQWKYYNHALIPATEPHIECIPPKNKRTFWKIGGGTPLLARWITDWDCKTETNWWYVIKDTKFNIDELKAKRRYEINKGKKNFEVKRINPMEYSQELFVVTQKAYSGWPEKYKPKVEESIFKKDLYAWKSQIVYGGFERETGILEGYAYLSIYPEHLEFSVLRVNPESESKGINAAMVAAIVDDYNNRVGNNFYINDGSRSVLHETAFQDYLEKYFGFRKAYCRLHICYRFPISIFVKALFPFRNLFKTNGKIGYMVTGIMQMESICRETM